MSRLCDSVIVSREAFVKGLFLLDPTYYTIARANAALSVQPGFGLNKKLSLNRLCKIKANILAKKR